MDAPGGLIDGQRRPKALRVAGPTDWYVLASGRFELVGSGDLSERDLEAIGDEWGDTGPAGAVFVAVARPREIEEVLGGRHSRFGLSRITWSAKLNRPLAPRLAAVSRGARIALLPDSRLVWVDGERLFRPGETVPLPWTDPPVSLEVVRPRALRRAMRRAIGEHGPRQANVKRS